MGIELKKNKALPLGEKKSHSAVLNNDFKISNNASL